MLYVVFWHAVANTVSCIRLKVATESFQKLLECYKSRQKHVQVLLNPSPRDRRQATSSLLYVACPTQPILAMFDSSRDINYKGRSFVAPRETVAELLEVAAHGVEQEFVQQRETVMALRDQRARSLSRILSGGFGQESSRSFTVPISSGAQGG